MSVIHVNNIITPYILDTLPIYCYLLSVDFFSCVRGYQDRYGDKSIWEENI